VYATFYNLKENPFNLTPDPRYLFLSLYHKEALDHLLYGINERKGFIAITGGIGTGKTTLCRALLSHLDASTKSALIFNSFISDMELLSAINQEFGIAMTQGNGSKKDHVDALNRFLLKTFSEGGNALLLTDEAQNLSPSVLEQIRMISNLETEKEKLIQIVLVGQPELKEILKAPSMRQLDERITVRYDLKPLHPEDIKGYVEHRLVVAGGRGDLRFTGSAYKKIYAYSRGNPRRINAVCDRALLIGFAGGTHTISEKIVSKAIDDLQADPCMDPLALRRSGKRSRPVLLLIALLMFIVAAFVGWNFRKELLDRISPVQKTAVVPMVSPPPKPPEPEKKPAPLFLDERTSLSTLFGLFELGKMSEEDQGLSQLGLVSFRVPAEYYVIFKKPFRVHVSGSADSSSSSPRYLLIREVTEEGAIAIDAEGRDREVGREFILENWGEKVSWLYSQRNTRLMKGMSGPEVLRFQRVLSERGYLVEPTGAFDGETFTEVVRFQRDFGLHPDGIVGPRTMALIDQMME